MVLDRVSIGSAHQLLLRFINFQNTIFNLKSFSPILGSFRMTVDLTGGVGDQQYRNWSKFCAAVVAISLAALAGGLIYYNGDKSHTGWDYLSSPDLLAAILIGAISTPLAPIAKDLSSAIAAAVSAVSAWKR